MSELQDQTSLAPPFPALQFPSFVLTYSGSVPSLRPRLYFYVYGTKFVPTSESWLSVIRSGVILLVRSPSCYFTHISTQSSVCVGVRSSGVPGVFLTYNHMMAASITSLLALALSLSLSLPLSLHHNGTRRTVVQCHSSSTRADLRARVGFFPPHPSFRSEQLSHSHGPGRPGRWNGGEEPSAGERPI